MFILCNNHLHRPNQKLIADTRANSRNNINYSENFYPMNSIVQPATRVTGMIHVSVQYVFNHVLKPNTYGPMY